VLVGDVTYPLKGMCGPRVQRDYQLVVLHTGELDLKLDSRRIRVEAGEAILLSRGHREFFAFSRTQETRHSWCSIHREAIPSGLRKQFAGPIGPAPFLGRMTAFLEEARTISADADAPLRDGFYLGLGLALMCDFALVARQGMPGVVRIEALTRLGNFLRNSYADSLSLADLARNAGVSSQHLMKLCRVAGVPTPMQQLYRRRLEAASELLLGTGLSVGEIADRCGFANPFHFSRKFREAYEKSPLRWRQQRWSAKGAKIP
jgi:AraC family transcriptional regulator of arabinose operon